MRLDELKRLARGSTWWPPTPSSPSRSTRSPPASATGFAAGPLAPKGMRSFFITRSDNARLKEMKKASRRKKNRAVHRVKDAPGLLKKAESLLQKATIKYPFYKLQIPLCLVGGRRFAEIMNGRSTFEPVPGKPHHTRFTGQLKRKRSSESEVDSDASSDDDTFEENETAFTIPLLVPYTTFAAGLAVLRSKQAFQDNT